MAEFKMKIAEQVGHIHTQFESTSSYCRAYLTEDAPHFSAVITAKDREFEQLESWEEARIEGFRPRRYTDPHLERAALQRKFAEHLFDCDTLMFHGSLVAVDGQGYLFTAKSGTGKSTHTRLWREVFGSRVEMLNDDKPFLHVSPQGVTAYGTPWQGKHDLGRNMAVPLRAICVLCRGEENRIEPITPREALPMLLQQTFTPEDPQAMVRTLALVQRLSKTAGLYRLYCNMEPQAAIVARDGMFLQEETL